MYSSLPGFSLHWYKFYCIQVPISAFFPILYLYNIINCQHFFLFLLSILFIKLMWLSPGLCISSSHVREIKRRGREIKICMPISYNLILAFNGIFFVECEHVRMFCMRAKGRTDWKNWSVT